uniref:Interleukin 18 receptor 1 n=1 Tax=Mola mola TaxID=94237 RepID=A0A3Q4BSJ3_MOLML
MEKVAPVSLFFLLTSLTGACPQRSMEVNVKAGEMVVLGCPLYVNHSHPELIWTSHTNQGMDLTRMSSAEERRMGILVHGRTLVILTASVNHQGTYSCSFGNVSRHCFMLQLGTTLARYNRTCNAQEYCALDCPKQNIPALNALNITSKGSIWYKEGESLLILGYFSRVKKTDHGVYSCMRSYLYDGQIYNMTFKIVLDVKGKTKAFWKYAAITSPLMNATFHVDLGSPFSINCTASLYSEEDEVFWLNGDSFVETNDSLPIFYNFTRESSAEGIRMVASLVFRNVSQRDLSQNYTCKLETDSDPSSSVTVTLQKKPSSPSPSYCSLALSVISIVMVMVLATTVFVKFKINITLFLRDTLGCHSSISDGKSHDAFLMCYKSDTEVGLKEHDRKWLKIVLEETFGYSLCLFERDVLPGKAIAEAVLDCIELSQTVVLVPSSSDHCLGSDLLSAIHAALVERQTRLIFIKTEVTEALGSGSISEALQLLSKTGDCVTWKGESSMSPSSSFWKQLRYYLPAPQHRPTPRTRLLQTNQDDCC